MMVSFSCDECQSVYTRARIDIHFNSCHTHSVSCIDCGKVFNARSVRTHTSCISEAEKYGEKSNSNTYCTTCKLQLRGAVAAAQHYASKKHRAHQRRSVNPVSHPPVKRPSLRVQVKRTMKKMLRNAPKMRLKLSQLQSAVTAHMSQVCAKQIDAMVPSIANKSRRFNVANYIQLLPKNRL